MSLWSSYKNLSPRTRVAIGAGLVVYALVAQRLSDQAERVFGYTPSDEDKRRLESAVPRITAVDKTGREA